MKTGKINSRPLVYSCSGCSSAAQLANHLALALDRDGQAEMSCIAGVGAGIKPLVELARSGRPLVAIDGCALACAKACLAQQGLAPQLHVTLSEWGIRKRKHQDFDLADAARMRNKLHQWLCDLDNHPGQ